MNTIPNSHHRCRRKPLNPWSRHNLSLIKAACDVALLKHGLHVEQGFNYGQGKPKKGDK